MAESFSADWLGLREPVDHRSRPEELIRPLVEWWRAERHTRVVDLGSGAGSNMRWLAPRLGAGQHWCLVDHDAALLKRARSGVADPAVVRVQTVRGDLARAGLEAIARADLVTASALLDLVSESWLARLVDACRAARAAALFALSWDGRIAWDTPDPDDALVCGAVRAHQRRDKGLGPALGPAAGAEAERAFAAAGFRTRLSSSPWLLTVADRALTLQLIAGWADAAVEQKPVQEARVRAWAERRQRAVADRPFRLSVGHVDVLALPPT